MPAKPCSLAVKFLGSPGINSNCVDVGSHHLVEYPVNHAVPLNHRFTLKHFGNDQHPVMPAPIPGAFVAFMQVAFVLDTQCVRFKSFREEPVNFCFALLWIHFGNTRLNGVTSTDS